ncbi:MAG TPA: SDR family NAD(P)-dependent oxidoreductase, partial [Roseococcus sp.]|nr:SDR family NAD(P)-dependent oxidoreductase [Roseococcus sp.]
MMFDLSGRVALVTGGNGGIGLGMAKGLAANGGRLAVTGRNAAKNAAATAELPDGTLVIEADLTEPGACDRALAAVIERFGRLDILVNNAGTNIRRRPEDVSDADWATVLDTNLGQLMRMTRGAYPHLRAHGVGRVINVASIMSLFGLPFSPAYAASK